MYVLFEYNKIYEKGKREGAIEELEKIKEEMLNLGFTGYADKPKLKREDVLKVLDNKELKGEQE